MSKEKHEKEKFEIQKIEENNAVDIKKAAWLALSPETQASYTSDYKMFFEFVKKDSKDVKAADILDYVEHLKKSNYKNNSINRKIASLSKMFKIMVLVGEKKTNPVDILKNFKKINMNVDKEVRMSLTIDDIKKATKVNKDTPQIEKQLAMIIKTLAKSGLRVSEFINIKNTDIKDHDEDTKIIRIVGKGNKERFSYMEKNLYKEIKKIYPDISGIKFLFYTKRKTPYNRKVLWRQIKVFFEEKTGIDVHPHLLRHFFATYLINVKKKDIKAVSLAMGHSDVSITLRAYVDTSLNAKDSIIKI